MGASFAISTQHLVYRESWLPSLLIRFFHGDTVLLCLSSYSKRTPHIAGHPTPQWLNSCGFSGWFCLPVSHWKSLSFPSPEVTGAEKVNSPPGRHCAPRGKEPRASCSYKPDSSWRHWLGCRISTDHRDKKENCVGGVLRKLKSWIRCCCNILGTVKIRHMYDFRQTFKWQHNTAASAIGWVSWVLEIIKIWRCLVNNTLTQFCEAQRPSQGDCVYRF